MANRSIRAESARDNLTPQLSPREALLLLLEGVRTLDQSDEWVEDYRMAGHMLSRGEQIDLACFAAMRRVSIERGLPLREFV